MIEFDLSTFRHLSGGENFSCGGVKSKESKDKEPHVFVIFFLKKITILVVATWMQTPINVDRLAGKDS